MENLEKVNHIKDFKWINRVLIVKNHNSILEQIKENEKNILERDLIIILIKDNSAHVKNYILSDYFYNSLDGKLQYMNNVNELILIGLDGRVKKVYKKGTDLSAIFSDIDKMPMRINEIKNNNF
tara:strand:+ start:8991 stop:9362 length:372 start_codon:yes stop_codon:yes gene_type:complete